MITRAAMKSNPAVHLHAHIVKQVAMVISKAEH